MTTEQLFLYDSYRREFQGKVIKKDGKEIILDKTIFHPITGGVAHDTGYIQQGEIRYRVERVKLNKENKNIRHILEEEPTLKIGDTVTGIIDWNRRYKLMRLHTAAHLLAAIMYRDYNALITGGQVDYQHAKLDFNLQKTDRKIFIDAVEKANEAVKKKIPLKIYFLSREEALKIPGVVKLAQKMPPEEKRLRIVEIPGIDLQADGGPHVKNTEEVGEILLVKVQNKGKNRRRIYFDVKS